MTGTADEDGAEVEDPPSRPSVYVERARLLALVVILVMVLGSQWSGVEIDPWAILAVLALGLGLQDWPSIFGRSGP